MSSHLKRKFCLDLIGKDLSNDAVKVGQHLHGELGLDASLVDQVIQSIGERKTDANIGSES